MDVMDNTTKKKVILRNPLLAVLLFDFYRILLLPLARV
jgi:hypothetical protein